MQYYSEVFQGILIISWIWLSLSTKNCLRANPPTWGQYGAFPREGQGEEGLGMAGKTGQNLALVGHVPDQQPAVTAATGQVAATGGEGQHCHLALYK